MTLLTGLLSTILTMSRGLGTVYVKTRKRADGGIRQFYVSQKRITVNGEKKRIEGQGQSAEQAIEALNRAIARALNAAPIPPRTIPARTGTLTALMTEWSSERDCRDRTREHTDSVIKNHISTHPIGGMMPRRIRKADIDDLINSRDSGWTKIAVYKALRSFITYALTKKIMITDPMTGVSKPKTPRARHANGPAMEARTTRLRGMLAWIHRTDWDKENPMYWARLLLSLNGLRPAEARGLTWENVIDLNGKKGIPRVIIRTELEYAGGTLKLIPVKTDVPRTVVLTPEAAAALSAWKKTYNGLQRRATWKPREGMENLVLTADDGKPLTQQKDSRRWNDLITEAQSTYKEKIYWTLEYNRHIVITLLRDHQVDAGMVSAIMGNTITVQNQSYYHSAPSTQQAVMSHIGEYLKTKAHTANHS
jgi:integrase